MKPTAQGYRVAVVGASSLLGKELITVLEERHFPISSLVTFEADEEKPDLPIVDLMEHSQAAVADEVVEERKLDFAFLAGRPQAAPNGPSFLRHAREAAGLDPAASRCRVIDLGETLTDVPGTVLTVPFLERGEQGGGAAVVRADSRFFVSAHPAAILISSILLRLGTHFRVERAVAQVFLPVSEIGARGIEELQKQTVNLLSFQKIPQAVFGAQLAFNLLPRLGRSRRSDGAEANGLTDLENRLRRHLREYLSGRVPIPALCIFQTPVFYSMAVSLYVETADEVAREALGRALDGEPIHVRRASQQAPSQVEATGSANILVDAISPDADHPRGIWIWAVADNLRLAAVNAVEIAESLRRTK